MYIMACPFRKEFVLKEFNGKNEPILDANGN